MYKFRFYQQLLHQEEHFNGEQDCSAPQIILTNIDFISSSSGTIHSKIISLNSIDSSSIINAGSFFISNSFFNSSELSSETSMNSFNHKSTKELFTNSLSLLYSSHFQ